MRGENLRTVCFLKWVTKVPPVAPWMALRRAANCFAHGLAQIQLNKHFWSLAPVLGSVREPGDGAMNQAQTLPFGVHVRGQG